MIYLDSSVLLASIFEEKVAPPGTLWDAELSSSRLLEYEVWVRLNAYGLASSHGGRALARLGRVNLVGLGRDVLMRSLTPFPVTLRTLDALHLATMDFLRRRNELVELASYDRRLTTAAQAMGFALAAL